MLEPLFQGRALFTVESQRRMYPLRAHPFHALAGEAGKGGTAKGRAPAITHQPLPHIVVHGNQVPVSRGGGDDLAYFHRQFCGYPFIGIHFQNPVALAGGEAGIAAVAFKLPRSFYQAAGMARGDGLSAVAAVVEHHHDLVGECQTIEAVRDPVFLVMGHHQRRESAFAHGVPVSGALPLSPVMSPLPLHPRYAKRKRGITKHRHRPGIAPTVRRRRR